jgi:hypothetical protein
MNVNKLLAPVGVALLALLVVVMIPAQGAHRRPKNSMMGKEQLRND